MLAGRRDPMTEVAQPWDLPRPLPRHWRAPSPSHMPWLLSTHQTGHSPPRQPQSHLLPGMPTLQPPCHI